LVPYIKPKDFTKRGGRGKREASKWKKKGEPAIKQGALAGREERGSKT